MFRSSCIVFILLANIAELNSVSANSQSDVVVVDKQRFLWKLGGEPYEVVGTILKGWNDPGEYTELTIRIPDGKQLVLIQLTGIRHKDISVVNNLLNSPYLLVIQGARLDKGPFLVLTEYAFASSPGYVSVLALNDKGYPEFVFREMLNVSKLNDYDGDGHLDILVRGGVGEPWGGGQSYDPYLVYTQKFIDGHIKFEINNDLSRKWGTANQYPWAGSRYSEKYLVTRGPSGAKIKKVERTNDNAVASSPRDALIQYLVDHTYPNGIRHALIDKFDNFERLKKLDKKDLNIVKNAIFARRGYVFKRQDLQDFFDRKSWYKRQKNLPVGDAIETDAVDKATLDAIDLIEKGANPQIVEQLEKVLRMEKRTDTVWNDSNVTRMPPGKRASPVSLGGLHVGEKFDHSNFEKQFGKIIWTYQAAHQAGEFGGRNMGFTANIYLFKGLQFARKTTGTGSIFMLFTLIPHCTKQMTAWRHEQKCLTSKRGIRGCGLKTSKMDSYIPRSAMVTTSRSSVDSLILFSYRVVIDIGPEKHNARGWG